MEHVHEQGNGRVLVVDDDRDMRDLLCQILAEAGFKPVRAYNGREAMVLLHSISPRFVILDLAMPEMSGWDVLKAMKTDRALAAVPVVVVAGRPLLSSGLRKSDVAAYLQKPLDVERFSLVLDYFRHRAEVEGAAAH